MTAGKTNVERGPETSVRQLVLDEDWTYELHAGDHVLKLPKSGNDTFDRGATAHAIVHRFNNWHTLLALVTKLEEELDAVHDMRGVKELALERERDDAAAARDVARVSLAEAERQLVVANAAREALAQRAGRFLAERDRLTADLKRVVSAVVDSIPTTVASGTLPPDVRIRIAATKLAAIETLVQQEFKRGWYRGSEAVEDFCNALISILSTSQPMDAADVGDSGNEADNG